MLGLTFIHVSTRSPGGTGIMFNNNKNWGIVTFRWWLMACLFSAKPLPQPILVHHDDIIKWKHFPRYWPFVRGIHRSPVNSPHKGQRRGVLMFSFICASVNGWVNNREAGDLRRHRAHYDVTVMIITLRDNLWWHFNQNSTIFIEENLCTNTCKWPLFRFGLNAF